MVHGQGEGMWEELIQRDMQVDRMQVHKVWEGKGQEGEGSIEGYRFNQAQDEVGRRAQYEWSPPMSTYEVDNQTFQGQVYTECKLISREQGRLC